MPKRSRARSAAGTLTKKRKYNKKNYTTWMRNKQMTARVGYGHSTGFQVSARRVFAPDVYRTKLVYFDANFSINPSVAGEALSKVWRANSVYDPEYAVGGHQPTGFDQIIAMYKNFHVVGVKCQARIRNGDTSYYALAGIYVRDSELCPTDYREIIENGMGSSTALAPRAQEGELCFSDMECSADIVQLSGMTLRNYLANEEMGGTASANPSKEWYIHIWLGPSGAVDLAAGGVDYVRLEYDVIFTNPNSLAIS